MPDPQRRLHRAPRTSIVFVVGLAALCPPAVIHAAGAPQTVALVVGRHQELTVDSGVERVALADESVAGVNILRKDKGSPAARLLLTGKAPGVTTLMVWAKGGAAARTYLLEVGRPGAVLEGAVASLPAHRAAVADALASRPKDAPLHDRSVVDVRGQTVQVEVRIVEFSRNVLKEIGVSLSPYGPNSHGFTFQSAAAGALSDAFSLALGFRNANKGRGLDLTLSLLEGNGLARVLAEPTLVTLSGQSASFLSGGELPIPVPQGLGATTIQYKPFGIGLSVTPTVLSNERIALKVAPEASDLDYTNAVSINGVPVPAITTRRADTSVELGDGESFIIGELVSRATVSNANKVPLLGDLPVIGALFRQQTYQMNEKELVILVTPHLVRPMARETDVSTLLPGNAEQRDGHVWQDMLLGGASRGALPGFSR
jgi:pilus assembly protein CpaC